MDEYSDGHLPSKSERKREMDELQQFGERLMALKENELARLPLTPRLRAGIDESRRITSHEARRRHAQFIGRLMREENGDAVIAALAELDNPMRQKWLADWQDRVLALDTPRAAEPLIGELLERYPDGDRQHLRNLIRNVLQARVRDEEVDAAARDRFRRERKKLSAAVNELERNQPLGEG